MPITHPYHRLFRPVKGYEWGNSLFYDDTPHPTLDFLEDERFVCQAEIDTLVTTAHLIVRDLYEIFNYVEPTDANRATYSHRIYALYLRTATEFENNCKAILRDNGYFKAENAMNIQDYFKIASAAKLSEYEISFNRWSPNYEFRPFETWNTANFAPLPWYQSYNNVKHNRYAHFNEANLGNLLMAVSGLLCILHVQYGEYMGRACFEGINTSQTSQEKVVSDTFTITVPQFVDDEQYDFIWDMIKTEATPVQSYTF